MYWLADLAGTRGRPLSGCETFAFRFPQHVLQRFVWSFSYVTELARHDETSVSAKYLEARWLLNCAPLGLGRQPHEGRGELSVALMRLSAHMQDTAERSAVVHAFRRAPAAVTALLGAEMAMTGLDDQSYAGCDPQRPQRPALLIMYSPQFLRAMVRRGDAMEGLCMLAEVYRVARAIWPRDGRGPDTGFVTVRIDQLRDRTAEQIMEVYQFTSGSRGWFMCRRGEAEATVECQPLFNADHRTSNARPSTGSGGGGGTHDDMRLLAFWRLKGSGEGLVMQPPGAIGLEGSAAGQIKEKRAFRFDITGLRQ